MSTAVTSNGPAKVEDSAGFVEQNLEEVLHSVPDMNESPQAVHSGSPPLMSPFSGSVEQPFRAPMSPPNQQRTVSTPGTLPTLNQQSSHVPPATTTIPLTSPSPTSNGDELHARLTKPSQSKIDYFKQWSISTYKCTRQILSEKLGKGSRTVDLELEAQIEVLRETQRKYLHILRMARALTSHFHQMVQTQHSLSEAFSDLAHKSPELQEEFLYNAETQKNLSKNGDKLLGALNFFVSSLNTLCNKTIEDTLLTVKHYENARLEYDAYRTDLEELMQASQGDSMSSRVDEAQRNFALHKEKYERLRSDVSVKMKFLEENKVKVMHKQLLLFHNAISAYFSGNQVMLDSTLKQFNIKMKNPNATSPSWLEQ